MNDLGKTLDSVTIEKGLQELNPDIHFDMGTKLNQQHPMQDIRQGVFYKGMHICSMDRGVVPEFKVWTVAERMVPVSLSQGDEEGVAVSYKEVPRSVPGYSDLYNDAKQGKIDSLVVRNDGKLIEIVCTKQMKVRDRIISVGWRHTFERLLMANIPGVTRDALQRKFGVEMFKFVNAPPDEIAAVLCEE